MAAMTARRASDAEHRLFALARGATSVERGLDQLVDACLLESFVGPPTDLALLASHLNVVATERKPLPIDGFTTRDSTGAFRVVLDSEMSETRRRFTLAHELGHILLERNHPGPPRESKDLEDFCDRLASRILMPKSVFLSHIASGLPSEIPNLARIFDVSLVAATRRLAWLKGWIAFESRNGKLIWSQPPSVILDVAQLPRSVEPTTFDGTIDGVFSTWRAEPTVANTRSTIGVVFGAI